jgi:hypothetical protein
MANAWREWKPYTPETQLMSFNYELSLNKNLDDGEPEFLNSQNN